MCQILSKYGDELDKLDWSLHSREGAEINHGKQAHKYNNFQTEKNRNKLDRDEALVGGRVEQAALQRLRKISEQGTILKIFKKWNISR